MTIGDHILIEAITPAVDQGRYPVKRVVGQPCVVEADIFRDGHDVLRAVVCWRRKHGPDAEGRDVAWQEAPMAFVDNDRWRGEFRPDANARFEYTVEAWTDAYATWLADLRKRVEVAEPIRSEVVEGIRLLNTYADAAEAPAAASVRKQLKDAVAQLSAWAERKPAPKPAVGASAAKRRSVDAAAATAGAEPEPVQTPAAAAGEADGAEALAIAEHPALLEAVSAVQPRAGATRVDPPLQMTVDRPRALFSSWYELFPRSQGNRPGKHATFAEAAKGLPRIADLGFDVVYLPPIHPVGTSHRKGRNNTLVAEPGDPGSPWAIGSPDGGHTAVERQLGTLDDFDRYVAAANKLGMEIALDFAIQASPDHPWVSEHPEWFYHRPDGTIKYAENPPKKYQDVYPINFDTEDREGLWNELRDVMLFWIGHGVKIFRVDNPHTKPFAFWEWAIATVQERHPEVIFLAEAFTRPKVMKALGKIGFTQSYTYFTWRNYKAELMEYLTELTRTEMAEYYRPNFFANTPDILHAFLQDGGRPAFKIRLVLAATLSPTYGIYSGFELCENIPVQPGSEEYLHSEKYEVKVRDWDAPGNINEMVARVNRIRHENPALQQLTNLTFLPTDNDRLLCYAKVDAERGNAILVAVNLDPHNPHHGTVTIPPDVLAPGPVQPFTAHDLLTGARFPWGPSNYIRLDPEAEPAHILCVEPA